ncbi:MAG: hypothetical protein ACK4ND_16420 [Cytophagaceae bacterium]
MVTFCTDSVFVNGLKILDYVQSSVYEIDLTHLSMNDSVHIVIFHKNSCKPKILNQHHGCSRRDFRYLSFKVDKDSLYWKVKALKKGDFCIEKFENNTWNVYKISWNQKDTILSYPEMHHSGLNKYRIKFIQDDGQVFYSNVQEYYSSKSPLKIHVNTEEHRMEFSRTLPMELLDPRGNCVTQGEVNQLNLITLAAGKYYLNTDNKTYKLIVKLSKGERRYRIKL